MLVASPARRSRTAPHFVRSERASQPRSSHVDSFVHAAGRPESNYSVHLLSWDARETEAILTRRSDKLHRMADPGPLGTTTHSTSSTPMCLLPHCHLSRPDRWREAIHGLRKGELGWRISSVSGREVPTRERSPWERKRDFYSDERAVLGPCFSGRFVSFFNRFWFVVVRPAGGVHLALFWVNVVVVSLFLFSFWPPEWQPLAIRISSIPTLVPGYFGAT